MIDDIKLSASIIVILLWVMYYFWNNDMEHLNQTSNEAIQDVAELYNVAQLTITNLSAKSTVTIGCTNIGYPLYVGNTSIRDAIADFPTYSDALNNSAYLSTPQYTTYMSGKTGGFVGDVSIIPNYILVQHYSKGQKAMCSAYFSGSVVSPNFMIISDERIKKNINKCDSFDKLNEIDVYGYEVIENCKKVKYGVVAQQIEKVLPGAINTVSGFVPNVLKSATVTIVENKLHCKFDNAKHDFIKGDMLKIMVLTELFETKILDVCLESFILDIFCDIAKIKKCPEIFIVGKKVDDFKTVDINTIVCLSIGYIQNQSKEINELKTENNELKEMMKKLEQRLDKLELGLA